MVERRGKRVREGAQDFAESPKPSQAPRTVILIEPRIERIIADGGGSERMPSLCRAALALVISMFAVPATAEPITWYFEGEFEYVQKGSFDPGFELGRVQGDEFVPTRFKGELTFDPSNATLIISDHVSEPLCYNLLASCVWAMPGEMVVNVEDHTITAGLTRVSVTSVDMPGYAHRGGWSFSFSKNGFRYDESVLMFAAANLDIRDPDADVLLRTVRIPAFTVGGFGFTIWPDAPIRYDTATNVSGRLTMLGEMPEPDACVLLAALFAVAGFRRRTPS